MADIQSLYLPTLHYFAMNNPWTGSFGLLRFKIVPSVVMRNAKEVNMEESSIHVESWHGLLCYECSTMEENATFDMSEEGREALRQWLFDRRDASLAEPPAEEAEAVEAAESTEADGTESPSES